jgi:hypothetical protein
MRNKIRKIVVIGCSFLFLIAAVRIIWVGIVNDRDILAMAVPLIVTLCLSFGLFQQYRWALRATGVVFLLCAVLLPVGIFNPFTAGDYLTAGKELPSVGRTLLWLIPVEIFLLASVYIIDPRDPKKEIR